MPWSLERVWENLEEVQVDIAARVIGSFGKGQELTHWLQGFSWMP